MTLNMRFFLHWIFYRPQKSTSEVGKRNGSVKYHRVSVLKLVRDKYIGRRQLLEQFEKYAAEQRIHTWKDCKLKLKNRH